MPETPKKGIKEISELAVAAFDLAAFFRTRLKDGAGVDDLIALVSNKDLRAELIAAVSGVTEIKGELQDLDGDEIVELGELTVDGVRKILAA